jgi:hypothetical protein
MCDIRGQAIDSELHFYSSEEAKAIASSIGKDLRKRWTTKVLSLLDGPTPHDSSGLTSNLSKLSLQDKTSNYLPRTNTVYTYTSFENKTAAGLHGEELLHSEYGSHDPRKADDSLASCAIQEGLGKAIQEGYARSSRKPVAAATQGLSEGKAKISNAPGRSLYPEECTGLINCTLEGLGCAVVSVSTSVCTHRERQLVRDISDMPENKGESATRKVVSEGAKLEEMASLWEQSSYGKILRSSGGSLSHESDATDKEKLEEMASLREQSSYGKRLRSSGGSLSQEGDDFEEAKVYKTSGIGRSQICEACSSEIQGDIYHLHGEERAFQVEEGLYHLICEDCYFIWQVQGGKLILIANASTRSSARTSRRIESDGLEDQDNLTEREAEAQEDAGMQTRGHSCWQDLFSSGTACPAKPTGELVWWVWIAYLIPYLIRAD